VSWVEKVAWMGLVCFVRAFDEGRDVQHETLSNARTWDISTTNFYKIAVVDLRLISLISSFKSSKWHIYRTFFSKYFLLKYWSETNLISSNPDWLYSNSRNLCQKRDFKNQRQAIFAWLVHNYCVSVVKALSRGPPPINSMIPLYTQYDSISWNWLHAYSQPLQLFNRDKYLCGNGFV